jgi:imidazolonepropionase-like amidohydrolase
MKTILTNCTVIDCTGQAPQHGMTVVIEGDKIAGLSTGSPGGTGARVLDLEGGYALPGLWEVHTHLGDLIPDPHNLLETETIGDYTIRAGRNAMDALRAGITGIRVVGESSFVDVAWKRAFEAGVMVGPRLFVCTRGISITGGHGHGTLGALEVDGPWEMRKAVRENLKHGADQIKLMVTGGIMTEGETMQESQFLLDEIQAATEVAHQKGKRVAVHAWGAPGIKTAIRGGVDSIEHGLLDDEAIQMMLDHDVFYVPTISATQDEEFIRELPEFQIKKARDAASAHLEGFQKALKAGVKIACGSDSTPTAEFTRRELEHMVKAGMSEMDALIAATRTGADLCEVGDRLGTIEVGKLADLLVLSANPLEDISNIRKVKYVVKAGNLVNLGPDEGLTDFLELYC